MPELIADVPLTHCYLRTEYLYDEPDEPTGEYDEAYWFGITSIQGRAIMPQVITARGVLRQHIPISALCTKPHRAHIPLEALQLWNCFSYHVVARRWSYLDGFRCDVLLKDGSTHRGDYLFTLDWYGNAMSESPGEGGHKSANIIALDCGCIAAQPDNRVLWREASFVTKPLSWDDARGMGYRTNTREWRVERSASKWVTEDDDQFFYRDVHHGG